MQQSDNVSRVLLLLILICLVALMLRPTAQSGSEPAAGSLEAGADGAEPALRYDLSIVKMLRGAPLMLRTDTATGEGWRMGLLAAGEWEALDTGPNAVPSAGETTPGRYAILGVAQKRGAPTLVRVDGETGRIWRKGSKSSGPWVAVPNPGEPPLVPATALPQPPAARPAGNPAAAAAGAAPGALDPESDDADSGDEAAEDDE